MKTNELIKLLQETDPNNECDVCINNHPISDVDRMPSWYDGKNSYFEKDANGNVIKAGYRSGHDKIKILFYTLEDILLDNPDIEIDFSAIQNNERYTQYINDCIKNGQIYKQWSKEIANLPSKLWPDLNIEDLKSLSDLEKVGLKDIFYILLKICKQEQSKSKDANKQTLFSRIKNCFKKGKII